MKALFLLISLACCYQISYLRPQLQYNTIWTCAHSGGCNFVWTPTLSLNIASELFIYPLFYPVASKSRISPSSISLFQVQRKSIIKEMLSEFHAAALRLLVIMAGDVEKNPGPTDSQSAMTSQSVNQSESVIQPVNQSDQTHSGSTDQSKQTKSTTTGQSNPRMKCPSCEKTFARKSDLMRHDRSKHQNQKFPCLSCQYVTDRKDILKRHTDFIHGEGPSKRVRIEAPVPTLPAADPIPADSPIVAASRAVQLKKVALKGELKTYQLPADAGERDLELFLNTKVPEITNYISHELIERTGLKVLLNPRLEFFKPVHPEEVTTNYFSHKPIEVYRGTDLEEAVQITFPPILKAIDEFTREGSGWAVQQILYIDIHIARLAITRGSSYKKLPKELARKEAIINIKNRDNKCFMWSILAKLHPVSMHAQRVSKYKSFEHELDFDGIAFPVAIKDISKIEKRNGLAINLYGYENDVGIYPLCISKETDKRWIHLLLYEGHYCLIKNLDRLLFDQRGHESRKYFCPRCLTPKYSEQDRETHYKVCCLEEPTKTIMPTDTELKFRNYKKMLRQPLVLYADFECLTEKVEGPRRGNTIPYQKHTPCGYGLVGVSGCCGGSTIGTPTVYRGEDCIKRFFTEIAGFAAVHQETLNEHEKIIDMTPTDWIAHQTTTCHICKEHISWQPDPNDEMKVRDHCHFCGKYRGPAHRRCNRDYRKNRDIVVVVHNLRRYDTHLLMQEAGGAAKLHGWELDVVAKTMEDYISFSLVHRKEIEERRGADELGDEPNVVDHTYKINFIDSFQFMNRSLAELVGNLEKDRFHAMSQEFEGAQLELLLRKGVYPYDYMDAWERFDERVIPKKQDFYSKLNDERISDEDYRHAAEVWRRFDIGNLGQYHDLYLKTDVLLLADVFEEFRKIAVIAYELDPCHYMTAPSLTWDACLKMTGVILELLQDPDIYMFFEQGIRGGVSQISHRYAAANNKYLPSTYDSTKPSTYIMYLDANNLYGYAMVQPMPTHNIKWVEDLSSIPDISTIADNAETGYVLLVDLEYPAELHDAHASYPLAPEHMTVTDVSPYCQELRGNLGLMTPPTRKLVTTLHNKKRYIIHYRNLKLYQSLGLKVTKIHKAISFKQSKWMEPYIMSNTKRRTEAKNGFEKDFYKLMNNAAFGKTMEDVRKYKNVELVVSEARHRKLAANPRYRSSAIFTEDLVGVCSLRASTCLNKPIYCGFTVLDLSKALMYRFHYEYIVPKYGPRAKLLFTDTDSLCYLIETDDVYTDMAGDADLFDFSDYPKDHPLYSTNNKKVIGKMKDELAGIPILEFLGLRPKMYSIKDAKGEKKTAKGIKKRVVKNAITHQDYVNTLFDETPMSHDMSFIQSRKHQVETVTMTKKSLSPYDDKRWLLDNINSLPYGHYRISGPSSQSAAGDVGHGQ